MKIKILGANLPSAGALVLLVGAKASLSLLGKAADSRSGGAITRAMTAASFDGKREAVLDIIAPAEGGFSRILLIGLGETDSLTQQGIERLGGVIAGSLQSHKIKDAAIAVDLLSGPKQLAQGEGAAAIASGIRLRNYAFLAYKTRKTERHELGEISILTADQAPARKLDAQFAAIAEGVHLARDLVNEPANVLFPEAFASRAKALTKAGLKVEVLTPTQMEKLGMGALLGVAQGSVREARMVVMQWHGGGKSKEPVAFIGKGVTFDTGGISIKPAAGMEDMKGDMGGAACVTGLMLALAKRKAKVNAVGIIGLVENMPDGNAQRPGDIVTSMSGQTIAVLNTDAEGRLVLADCLWYAQKRFKPRFMVDLATLTGAILVALGKEHAGLFSNNDELSERLSQAGLATGEKVWRLPLAPEYDKMIDSDIADMKNIGGRLAGSITAAQFLQRFVNNVPWAHLDVAGTAMDAPKSPINQSWGSGWGVRLLNKLVADHYEG